MFPLISLSLSHTLSLSLSLHSNLSYLSTLISLSLSLSSLIYLSLSLSLSQYLSNKNVMPQSIRPIDAAYDNDTHAMTHEHQYIFVIQGPSIPELELSER